MQQTCPQCGSYVDGTSRFCTNCGATLGATAHSPQAWQTPPASQVPPWAQAQGGMYQQRQSQWAGASGPQGMSVSGGQGNATAKKLLFILGGVILGGLLLLIGSIFLALISPAPLSTFFWVVAVVIFVIAWIIYSTIRRMIRRTIGGLWRFF